MNEGSTSHQARLRDRLREEMGRAILEAAEAVFAEDGLHAARMERIASRAGVAVGTLYNHFKDKDALLASLVRASHRALLERVDRALSAAAGEDVRARLRAFLSSVAAHAREHGRFLAVLVQAGEGPARLRPQRTLLAELVARVDRVVADGVAAGDLRADGAELFGHALVGMARAMILRSIESGAQEDVSDAVVDIFLRGAAR
ncbi:MAG TPA: TetR/AcrR family transcriptional regulator [Anaeromyxobacter sp.]